MFINTAVISNIRWLKKKKIKFGKLGEKVRTSFDNRPGNLGEDMAADFDNLLDNFVVDLAGILLDLETTQDKAHNDSLRNNSHANLQPIEIEYPAVGACLHRGAGTRGGP